MNINTGCLRNGTPTGRLVLRPLEGPLDPKDLHYGFTCEEAGCPDGKGHIFIGDILHPGYLCEYVGCDGCQPTQTMAHLRRALTEAEFGAVVLPVHESTRLRGKYHSTSVPGDGDHGRTAGPSSETAASSSRETVTAAVQPTRVASENVGKGKKPEGHPSNKRPHGDMMIDRDNSDSDGSSWGVMDVTPRSGTPPAPNADEGAQETAVQEGSALTSAEMVGMRQHLENMTFKEYREAIIAAHFEHVAASMSLRKDKTTTTSDSRRPDTPVVTWAEKYTTEERRRAALVQENWIEGAKTHEEPHGQQATASDPGHMEQSMSDGQDAASDGHGQADSVRVTLADRTLTAEDRHHMALASGGQQPALAETASAHAHAHGNDAQPVPDHIRAAAAYSDRIRAAEARYAQQQSAQIRAAEAHYARQQAVMLEAMQHAMLQAANRVLRSGRVGRIEYGSPDFSMFPLGVQEFLRAHPSALRGRTVVLMPRMWTVLTDETGGQVYVVAPPVYSQCCGCGCQACREGRVVQNCDHCDEGEMEGVDNEL